MRQVIFAVVCSGGLTVAKFTCFPFGGRRPPLKIVQDAITRMRS